MLRSSRLQLTDNAAGLASKRVRRRPKMLAADKWFFPAAALYGALAVPLSVHGMLTGTPWLPGLGSVTGHAHELLFGYALAVVAGYLVTKNEIPHIALLFALWLAARMLWLFFPESLPAAAANLSFVALLGYLVVPKFTKSAKKLRNKAIGPLIAAICLAPVAFHTAGILDFSGARYLVLQESVLLLVLLMLFMGGRVIAPAVAGAIERAGGTLEARVQPRIEGSLLILMAAAIAIAAVPGGRPAAGIALIGAGVLAAIRLARWRLWRCFHRPDLICLGTGYVWLAAGLGMIGAAWLLGIHAGTATHAITVGALGTLTASVMARVYLLRAKCNPAANGVLPVIVGAMTAAAALRIGFGDSPAALAWAAGAWSVGLLLLLSLFVRETLRHKGFGRHPH